MEGGKLHVGQGRLNLPTVAELCDTNSHIVLGSWNESERSFSSTWRELEAAKRVLYTVGDQVRGQNVKVVMDNKNACSIVNVGSNKPDLQIIARDLNEFCCERDIRLYTQWVPRGENQTADYLSRCADCDDWSVQQWVFDQCEGLWGPHEVDRFASDYNRKCLRFNSRWWCNQTEAVDAFTVPWVGVNNWLVPPPRLICRTLVKLRDEKARGTLIVPVWRSAAFWPMLFCNRNTLYPFIIGYHNLFTKNVTLLGRGNNGCFGKPLLSFHMLALRVDFTK